MDLSTLPLFIVISESVTFVVTFMIFLGILLIARVPFSWYLALIPLLYYPALFAYALGFFFAMFVVFLRDLKEVVVIVFQIWFWFTPIV